MSDWTPPAHWSEETIAGWKALDHTFCSRYGLDFNAPAYEQCRSLHCGMCGKSTSSQGHLTKVGDEWVCPTPEEERTPWP
ncbi:hypothetical protein SEA_NANOSMITE_130 [Mycobacterium phage Nanosmite]|nr:hypothetical protein SEA_NANOSMITE_130 [Mycobacterium phage Nanosmite]